MFETEVNAGIQYFIDTDGLDFYRKIDLQRLDQSSSTDCMIGQLDGQYNMGRVARNITYPEIVDLGLVIPAKFLGTEQSVCMWDRLTETWRAKLTEMVEFDEAVERVHIRSAFDRSEREMVYG